MHLPKIDERGCAFWKDTGVASFQGFLDPRGFHQTVYNIPQTSVRVLIDKYSLLMNSKRINFLEW